MRVAQIIPVLVLQLMVLTATTNDDEQNESAERKHSFLNGSITFILPVNWVTSLDENVANRINVLSDAQLVQDQRCREGALGSFTIELRPGNRSPSDILAQKLALEGGPPPGTKIESMSIGGQPAARKVAVDEMFNQDYLWYTTVIQWDDGLIVYASFTGLGTYQTNGVIDTVIETITVDSASCQAALDAGEQSNGLSQF